MKYAARQSNHIQEDIARNWSSWNFGQDGFYGTEDEFQAFLASATDAEPVELSMFELRPSDIRRSKFGELHPGYWVLVDDRGGLSCNIIPAATAQQAIDFMNQNGSNFCGGDGNFVDCSDAKVIWSDGDIHILEIPE